MSALVIALATCGLVLLSPIILHPTRTLQTLRRKRYQYEVTFGLYMMTPTEKFIFSKLQSKSQATTRGAMRPM